MSEETENDPSDPSITLTFDTTLTYWSKIFKGMLWFNTFILCMITLDNATVNAIIAWTFFILLEIVIGGMLLVVAEMAYGKDNESRYCRVKEFLKRAYNRIS